MKLHGLKDLLVHQLRDIYYAEKKILKGLAKLEKAASSEELRRAFADHRAQSEQHVARLEEAFGELDLPARGARCPAIDGLLEEAQEFLGHDSDPAALDAALIACAQRVEHYEIAAYGCIRSFARVLGMKRIAALADKTIHEEGEADKLLTQLAEAHVNDAALTAGA
jgi:ferritin-like metal-binding protein YciE